jgi:membrane protein implicated in regulation of membrane protease activity
MDKVLKGLPWWVKWIGVPVIALVVFGTLVASLISFVVGLLFKVIVFVVLVGALVFVVKRVASGSSNSSKKGGRGRDW